MLKNYLAECCKLFTCVSASSSERLRVHGWLDGEPIADSLLRSHLNPFTTFRTVNQLSTTAAACVVSFLLDSEPTPKRDL
jgi:hypothetical protein